ncbi:hypothetical protein FACS1894151_02070 [Spirochaetia bacterium]|nr:hypothetical protein FACS1894151_02070 [Spirochaetia bacterium]
MDATSIIAYNYIMFGFLIKKNFFDVWDNMFRAALLNLGFLVSAAIPIFIPYLLSSIPVLGIISMGLGILWCCVYLAAAAQTMKTVSDYGTFGFADFFNSLKIAWPAGLVLGAIILVMVILITIAIPFYLDMNSIFGLMLASVIFWLMVVALLSLQFFLVIRARLDSRLPKALKKCFLIFFDNTFFVIGVFICNIIMLVLSTLLAFLFPGPAGIILFTDEALRLRLMKYDWLEENPPGEGENPKKRKIPWDALLIDEREKTGTRTLRNFIFPWKD